MVSKKGKQRALSHAHKSGEDSDSESDFPDVLITQEPDHCSGAVDVDSDPFLDSTTAEDQTVFLNEIANNSRIAIGPDPLSPSPKHREPLRPLIGSLPQGQDSSGSDKPDVVPAPASASPTPAVAVGPSPPPPPPLPPKPAIGS
ncbi:hypothetical protein SCLCIDRAFT_26959 [Scleroderma citrinum Foug A]|uniref:Uncharacterized protein n=1 Tax=Scleroderma citrinum Foug A TaxID=1036808 RepID=A0A0C2ZDI8_9AGAM|nr:hypothetical protein SCLCIDRAFT_26959 [Scleroderma citrinum Foug A]